jgi:outer membrane biosynthesis protein TonB
VSHSRAWILVCTISFSLLPGALAQAQGPDTLAFIISPSARITDSVTASMPASHRSAPEGIDQPAGVIYCPEPRYPGVLAEFGFDGDVDLQFVIDTSGRAELDDLVVTAASHPGFVEPARRAIAKCRYRPARKGGRAVRFLVRQRVRYHLRDEP